MGSNVVASHREPWNKGKIVGQKAPFKVKDAWANSQSGRKRSSPLSPGSGRSM
jgi:hypothetical protein